MSIHCLALGLEIRPHSQSPVRAISVLRLVTGFVAKPVDWVEDYLREREMLLEIHMKDSDKWVSRGLIPYTNSPFARSTAHFSLSLSPAESSYTTNPVL